MRTTWFIFLIIIVSTQLGLSQDSNATEEVVFREFNFGIASVENEFIFPGLSFLWGKTKINEQNTIFEYQAGIAFPSLVTGKIGIGKRVKSTNLIVGLRPYPTSFYLQSSFPSNDRGGYWIISLEGNPFSYNSGLNLFATPSLINLGYRWKKKRK